MVVKETFSSTGKTADQLRQELFRDEEFARQWQESEPRRRLSLALIEVRKAAGLTQRGLATSVGWDQAHVARMESATGPWPSHESLRAYAKACGVLAGYVFGHAVDSGVRIDGAVSFGSSDEDQKLERIAHHTLNVA